MDDQYSAGELQFGGMVVAGAAHEWGNVLAVIGESAGLLEDLAGLAGQGVPLDPERLAALAATVTRQVRRGNALLTCLRQFAHTVDTPRRPVDLAEAGCTMVTLTGRLAVRCGVELTAAPGAAVMVTCDPYRLCRLLFLCLEYAMAATGPGGHLSLRAETGPQGAMVTVCGLPETPPEPSEALLQAGQAVGASLRLLPDRLAVDFAATTDGP